MKLGPLDFTVRIEAPEPKPDGTPLPSDTPENAAALAAVKAATGVSGTGKVPMRDATPNPAQPKRLVKPPASKEGSKEAPVLSGSKEGAALKAGAAKPDTPPKTVETKLQAPSESTSTAGSLSGTHSDDDDKVAAMLLGMEDGGVPEGSTVIELPAVDAQGNPIPPAVDAAKDDKSKKPPVAQTREEMSTAASDLLRKMMRRPK